jgi:hypothetical protein
MPCIVRIPRVLASLAVALAIASLSSGAGLADDATGPVRKHAAPTRLDSKATELSPSALGMDEDKSKLDTSDADKSGLKLPDHINFGDNVLHFDTERKNIIPRVGVEANDQPVINKAPEESPLKPDYFGLRFTAPLH